MRWVVAAMLLAGPVQAQELIDYDLLLRENADKVETKTDGSGVVSRHLELAGGVQVTCGPDGCVGTDPGGAVGCTLAILSDLRLLAKVCEMPASDEDKAAFEDIYARVGVFAADNAVPPRLWADLSRELEEVAAQSLTSVPPEACAEANEEGSEMQQIYQSIIAPETLAEIEASLSTPRLPVMNHCL